MCLGKTPSPSFLFNQEGSDEAVAARRPLLLNIALLGNKEAMGRASKPSRVSLCWVSAGQRSFALLRKDRCGAPQAYQRHWYLLHVLQFFFSCVKPTRKWDFMDIFGDSFLAQTLVRKGLLP